MRYFGNNPNYLNSILYAICLAVIYPETTRYNDFSDLIETKILEIIYVKHGSEKSDFSIGLYQMKPSFIENVEELRSQFRIEGYDFVKYPWYFTSKEKRRERVKRMKVQEWQLSYARLYIEIAEILYKDHEFKNVEEKVLFYAAAYNYGFTRPIAEIKRHIHRKSFPSPGFLNTEKKSYAEMSLCYYQENHQRIFDSLICK